MISTRNLDQLPDVAGLQRLTRSLAMLDAILCPDWESRYYSFDSKWADGETMASMRDGFGDQWFALFTGDGVVLHGLAHESPMFRLGDPWPGIWESLPVEFGQHRTEPAFDADNSTFCIWRKHSDAAWKRGDVAFPEEYDDPDGSEELLSLLDGLPETYRAWAAEYYGVDLPLSSVAAVYEHAPITEELVASLNPAAKPELLEADAAEIGYPDGGKP